ncbi:MULTISPECIES: beta-N-acetylhexosaminidase [Clostridium]|nr:beta-N-acetylhexosaminidase [Clostridium cadaveris]MDM8311955.1 beta-N-acetylhexosaminidase [Clostridium cadaveris]MDU4951136.1 beta-N-acetylhexosaminidase [Clostridium sp.]UFH64848.1 beta-N-acetylhexosaminidase [Clostridium cadaveris]
MKKGKCILLISLLFLLLLGLCISQKDKISFWLISLKEKREIEKQINAMTLDEKVGQLVISGFQGETVSEELKELIEKYHIGGIILFRSNIKDSNQLVEFTNSIKEINSINGGVPIFVSVDQEGGRVSRLPKEIDKFPSAANIGKLDDEKLSYKIGNLLGETIKSFGFNLDFAPVLDIASNPENKVIGDRAFGDNPDIVCRMGLQFMNGLKDSNVISVVKHFPGHGDTKADSHYELPYLNHDRKRLDTIEFVPFKKAVEYGVDGIMVSHIVLKNIDDKNPATMSKTVATDILRKEFNYNGVIFTDDINMGAIAKNYLLRDAVIKSINAGVDVIVSSKGCEETRLIIEIIKEALKEGSISEERIDESIERILKLKNKYELQDKTLTKINPDNINKIINEKIK